MAAVRVDTGPIPATAYLTEVPRSEWGLLVGARRTFLNIKLPYDCRELLRFVEEATEMLGPLGYADVEDFIRRGLGLDPSLVHWAIAGLRALQPDEPIPFSAAVETGISRTQAAAQQTTGDVLPVGRPQKQSNLDYLPKGQRAEAHEISRATQHKLDWLARNAPAHFEQVKAGAVSVHRACIQAGHIKELSPLENALHAFRKLTPDDRQRFIAWLREEGELSPYGGDT